MRNSAPKFAERIKPFVDFELVQAETTDAAGKEADAFRHLERAHVLAQSSTVHHVRVHLRMLLWAINQRDIGEALGQVIRAFGAATKTVFGWVPAGNTGGSNINPFRRMPVPPDLAEIIRYAQDGK